MAEILNMNDMTKKKTLKTDGATIYQTNSDCQVFNGPISGCVFAMPGATVNHTATQQVAQADADKDVTRKSLPEKAKQTGKPKGKGKPKGDEMPQTVAYFRHGDKGLLMKQQERVDMVFRMLTAWQWIDETTLANDFDGFFEGKPRHCNIVWTANTTILTIWLQRLLKEKYVTKQKGVSAKSLVKYQFGKMPNSDKERLNEDSEVKIGLVLAMLDIDNPLPEAYQGNRYATDSLDERIAAFTEVYAEGLRISKGV